EAGDQADLFERIERLLPRLPAQKTHLEPIVWPWHAFTADRQEVISELIWSLGGRPPTRLLPYLSLMDAPQRGHGRGGLAEMKKANAAARKALLDLTGDPNTDVRAAAVAGLRKRRPTRAKVRRHVGNGTG